MENAERLVIGSQAQAHINAYFEYRNIVGDADGGVLLSEKEYEKFKQKAIVARKNRIYVSWCSLKTGMECRAVGPVSKCFCTHRYRDHETDNKEKRMFCRIKRCPCRLFDYVPVRGCQDIKCHCKHSYSEHDSGSKFCKRETCSCGGFMSSFGCACGETYSNHETIFETKEERRANGRAVDNLCGGGEGYAALGGITNFSSLIDGVERIQIDGPQYEDNAMFMRPKVKLNEADEMSLYAHKYERKSERSYASPAAHPSRTFTRNSRTRDSQMGAVGRGVARGKLRLLKGRRITPNSSTKRESSRSVNLEEEHGIAAIDQRISELTAQLDNSSLSEAKRYALKKQLQMAKANRIREKRRATEQQNNN
eukprot:185338_1